VDVLDAAGKLVGTHGSFLKSSTDVLFYDTFTGASIRLDAHAADKGGGWVILENNCTVLPANQLQLNGAGQLISSVATLSKHFIYGTKRRMPADVKVSVTYPAIASGAGTSDDTVQILARIQSHQTFYGVRIEGAVAGASNQAIYKKVSGVNTQLATLAGTLAASDVFAFVLRGSRLELWKNGVLILSATDTAIPGPGRCGVGMGDVFVTGDDLSTNWQMDDFTVEALRHPALRDEFVDTDATDLRDHRPNQGCCWVPGEIDAGQTFFGTYSNRARVIASSLNDIVLELLLPGTGEMAAKEYEVEVQLPGISASVLQPFCVVGYFQDADNYYAMGTWHPATANDKAIYKRIAGVWTLIAQTDTGLTANDILRAEFKNGAQALYQNGVSILTGADTALYGGLVGMGEGQALSGAGNSTTSWTIEYFRVWNLGGALVNEDQGRRSPSVTITALTYDVSSRDTFLIGDTTSNTVTCYLPPAGLMKDREIEYRNIGAALNNMILDGFGGELIDGAGTKNVGDGTGGKIRSDGTQWRTVATAGVL
jgi:hypothetical protein